MEGSRSNKKIVNLSNQTNNCFRKKNFQVQKFINDHTIF